MSEKTVKAEQGEEETGCCGGPVPENPKACCVRDAEAKAAGEPGCGCGSGAAVAEPVEKESGCCG